MGQADTFVVEAAIRHADGTMEYVNTTYNTDSGLSGVAGWLEEKAAGGTITRSIIRRQVDVPSRDTNIGAPWRERQAATPPPPKPPRLDDAGEWLDKYESNYSYPTLYVQGSLEEGGDHASA